jgi:hypothetical protein
MNFRQQGTHNETSSLLHDIKPLDAHVTTLAIFHPKLLRPSHLLLISEFQMVSHVSETAFPNPTNPNHFSVKKERTENDDCRDRNQVPKLPTAGSASKM